MLISAMTQTLIVSFSPGVHLAIFGERHWELAAAAHLHYVQVLQFLHKFWCLASVTASSAKFTIVTIPPGPNLTYGDTQRRWIKHYCYSLGDADIFYGKIVVQKLLFLPFSVTASVCASPLPHATSTTFSPFSAVTSIGVVWSSLEPKTQSKTQTNHFQLLTDTDVIIQAKTVGSKFSANGAHRGPIDRSSLCPTYRARHQLWWQRCMCSRKQYGPHAFLSVSHWRLQSL